MKEESLTQIFNGVHIKRQPAAVQGVKRIPFIKSVAVQNGNNIEVRHVNHQTIQSNGLMTYQEETEGLQPNDKQKSPKSRKVQLADDVEIEKKSSQGFESGHRSSLWKSNKVLHEKTDIVINLQAPKPLPKYLIRSHTNSEIRFEGNECKCISYIIYKIIPMIRI